MGRAPPPTALLGKGFVTELSGEALPEKDSLGQNGLGFIYFHGTTVQSKNLRLAFHHFNESAYGGSSDGMFNLASTERPRWLVYRLFFSQMIFAQPIRSILSPSSVPPLST